MKIEEAVTGIQHIGIPTNDKAKTVAFFQSLGFETIWERNDDEWNIAFLRLKNVVIETYQNGQATGKPGAVDHIALDVSDIEEAYKAVTAKGYSILEDGIQLLPFFEKGVRFFTIMGPDHEKVEFNQKL